MPGGAMLVMRRRAGESFLIGADIEIEILEVGPTRVKLGIVAPAQLAISRKEVILTRAENLTASKSTDPAAIAWLSRKLGRGIMDTVNSLTPADKKEKYLKNSAQKY
jgi:carbon storage regulator